VAVVRDDQSLLELSSSAGTVRQAEHPWRRRLLWAAAIVIAVVIGLAVFPNGFPQGLTIDVATPLNNANNWVIAHQLTNPVFVHVLNPVKNGLNEAVDQLVKGMARLTWLGLLTLVVAVAG
jgi:glycine betaine/proline transport system permease protein